MNNISIYSIIQSLTDIESDFSDRIIPAGTTGTIVECYENPEAYAADLAIPDKTAAGGFVYENVMLKPDRFVVISDDTRFTQGAMSRKLLPDRPAIVI